MADTGFVREAHRDIVLVGETFEGLFAKMAVFTPATNMVQMHAEDL